MDRQPTGIEGAFVFTPKVFGDSRGSFFEAFRSTWLPQPRGMVQWNISRSAPGVVRGLHYHRLQSDYWLVPDGQIKVALVDLRPASPTHRKALCLPLRGDTPCGLIIPPGVVHGYAIVKQATVMYLVDVEYTGGDEYSVRWNDPALGLPADWYDIAAPTLSNRDAAAPLLKDAPTF